MSVRNPILQRETAKCLYDVYELRIDTNVGPHMPVSRVTMIN